MAQQEYNGWKNWQTWNVAFWAQNDRGLYADAVRYANNTTGLGKPPTWRGFVRFARLTGATPDGAPWRDVEHDEVALTCMLRDLAGPY